MAVVFVGFSFQDVTAIEPFQVLVESFSRTACCFQNRITYFALRIYFWRDLACPARSIPTRRVFYIQQI